MGKAAPIRGINGMLLPNNLLSGCGIPQPVFNGETRAIPHHPAGDDGLGAGLLPCGEIWHLIKAEIALWMPCLVDGLENAGALEV